jgi:hypothetical protein
MEVAYSLTLEDLLAFRRDLAQKKKRPARKKVVPGWLFWALLAVVWALLIWVNPAILDWFGHGPGLFLLGFLTGVFSLIFLALGLTRRTERRYHANPANARLFGPRRLGITPEGVNAVSETSRIFESWAAVVKITASDEHAFLYDASNRAHIVPRRAFIDQADFDRFVELARRYWDESRLPTVLPAEPDEVLPARSEAITRKPE